MNLQKLFEEEKNVRLLEKIDSQLKQIKKGDADFSFVLPILFASIERLRVSDTPFPNFMFKKSKKIKK